MVTARRVKNTIIIWAIVCTLAISVCLMGSLIHPQEVYAGEKSISGTYKGLKRLAQSRIPVAEPKGQGKVRARNSVLRSADPDWNNAGFFEVTLDKSILEETQMGYGVITHPGGDQTFIEYEGKLTSHSGAESTGEKKGFFIGGTGKFKGIRARWLLKWSFKMGGDMEGEWKVEYF